MEMSEENKVEEQTENTSSAPQAEGVEMSGLYAFKVGMSAVYDENGDRIPVTVLKYEPMVISQIKTQEKDGYQAIQVAFRPDRASQTNKATQGALKTTGFENGAKFRREFRDMAGDFQVGQKIAVSSLKKGDQLTLEGVSKGHGFAGVMKRWDFGGGRATHGSGFHRSGGSVGNRTWPGRVMPGKRMAGRFGNDTVTIKNVQVVDVISEENVILLKGAVPGSRNSLVKLVKA
jgi:large subunit ribosomal protein L3